jgi:hypothetical protein
MIEEFIANVKGRGLARTNRYEVRIDNFPATSTTQSLVTLFCDAVNLPGMNLATTPYRFYGEAYEFPYERAFDAVTLSFYMDSGMTIKAGFDRWMSQIVNPQTREINYYNIYTRDVEIKLVNVDESQPYGVILREAYPKTISSMNLDAAGRDVLKLQVTLQYRYWEPSSVAAQALSGSS